MMKDLELWSLEDYKNIMNTKKIHTKYKQASAWLLNDLTNITKYYVPALFFLMFT